MANTTNYNWETPDDTDLVKDGAAAIRTLGNSIDTTTKNLNPETTTGDIAYRSATSNTNTRLAIGSAGQVLTVAAGVPSWATPTVGDITEVQAGVGISVASGTGPIPIITNSSTDLITTAGDLLYGTAADTVARLGIGTAGQVLQVNSGATAPEWATPAGGASGLTKIAASTFTNVASVSIDSVFSATYTNYIVIVTAFAGTNADDFQLQFRYSGNTQTSTYYGSGFGYNRSNSLTNWGFANTSQATLATSCGSNNGNSGTYTLNVSKVGSGSQGPVYYGSGIVREEDDRTATITGYNDTSRVYDGFLLKSSSSNITGSYAVYGVQA